MRSTLSLNRNRKNIDFAVGTAATEDSKDILQRRTGGRRHNSNVLSRSGNRLFGLGCEKPFLRQSVFQLLKGELQSPCARRLHVLADKLKFASALIERHPRSDADRFTLRWTDFYSRIGAPEHGAAHLRVSIFEREVPVSRTGCCEITDLALYPYPIQMRLKEVLCFPVEFTHRQRDRLLRHALHGHFFSGSVL